MKRMLITLTAVGLMAAAAGLAVCRPAGKRLSAGRIHPGRADRRAAGGDGR